MTARAIIFLLLGVLPAWAGERYALIGPDGTVVRMADNIDPTAQVKDGYQWVPAPLAEKPDYDPATEVIGPLEVQISPDEVTSTYTVRPKTADEFQADLRKKLDSTPVLRLLTMICDVQAKMAIDSDECKELGSLK